MAPNSAMVITWLIRGMWLGIALTLGPAVDALNAGLPTSVCSWLLWVAGAIALAVKSTITLTVARITVPTSVVFGVFGVVNDPMSVVTGIGMVLACAATLATCSAPIGRSWVQASAYGAEDRFPLRPPLGFLIASTAMYLIVATLVTLALVYSADGRIVVSIVCATLSVALLVLAIPRWHRLSIRWLVLVPVGVVVHDPLLLSETAMWKRHEVRSVALAETTTEAADLTGPSTGHALEIVLQQMATVVLNTGRRQPQGRAIHLKAALIAPTRPGEALAALRSRSATLR